MPKTSSKRSEIRARNRRSESQQRILVITLIAALALTVAFLIIWPSIRPVGDIVMPNLNTYTNVNQNGIGDPNAPVRIDEYSDYQCPACKYFYDNVFLHLRCDGILLSDAEGVLPVIRLIEAAVKSSREQIIVQL